MATAGSGVVESLPSDAPCAPGRTVQYFLAYVGYSAGTRGELVCNGRPVFPGQTRSPCSSPITAYRVASSNRRCSTRSRSEPSWPMAKGSRIASKMQRVAVLISMKRASARIPQATVPNRGHSADANRVAEARSGWIMNRA